jgi:hypothetical protein
VFIRVPTFLGRLQKQKPAECGRPSNHQRTKRLSGNSTINIMMGDDV